MAELIEGHGNQTAENRIGERFCGKPSHKRIEGSPMAQRAVGELLDEGAAAPLRSALPRGDSGKRRWQRRPVQHPADRERGQLLGYLHTLTLGACPDRLPGVRMLVPSRRYPGAASDRSSRRLAKTRAGPEAASGGERCRGHPPASGGLKLLDSQRPCAAGDQDPLGIHR